MLLNVVRADDGQGGDFVLGELASNNEINLCQACARLGHCRMGLRTERLDDGVVTTELSCRSENEGGPGIAHGGWVAGVLDELVGHVPILHGHLTVTGTLTVRFVKPVPIETPLLGEARMLRREGSRWYIEARLTMLSSGAELALAEAVMVERDARHYERHRQWLADQHDRQSSG